MTVRLTLYTFQGEIDFDEVKIESELFPDLTFTTSVNGVKKTFVTTLPYLIEREVKDV
jgi:hypothetical protein